MRSLSSSDGGSAKRLDAKEVLEHGDDLGVFSVTTTIVNGVGGP